MYVAPLTLATEWQTVQPIDMAVWTNFPLALSLWHSTHLEGATFSGSTTGCRGISANEEDAKENKTRLVIKVGKQTRFRLELIRIMESPLHNARSRSCCQCPEPSPWC